MAVDIAGFFTSLLTGIGIFTIVVILGIFALISAFKGKVTEQLRVVLGKLYSRTSLMLIAIFDVVAAFDPSQTLLGLAVAPVAGIVIFFSEWGLHDNFARKKFASSLIEGLIAAAIIAMPFPVTGLFVAWFGTVGYKKEKR